MTVTGLGVLEAAAGLRIPVVDGEPAVELDGETEGVAVVAERTAHVVDGQGGAGRVSLTRSPPSGLRSRGRGVMAGIARSETPLGSESP